MMICNKSIQILDQNNLFSKIEYNPSIISEAEIHNYIKKELIGSTFKSIIIPCSLGQSHTDYLGIRIALHLRLTKELGEKRFIPIIFLSFDSFRIINKFQPLASLLYAPGSYFYNYTDTWQESITNLKSASEKEFFSYMDERIIIPKPDKMGNHSLANEWGAYILGLSSRTIDMGEKPSFNSDFFSSLYIKNILRNICFDDNLLIEERIKEINKDPFKFLLIDDEAKKGWDKVLGEIIERMYPNANLNICESKEDTENINYSEYDLVFLDLRLNINEDNSLAVNDISNTSGAEILKKIKSKTPYVSVIMFTASNKAWNHKRIIDMGADDYYIKASPLNQFSPSFSKQNTKNLIDSIKLLVNKSSELRHYWTTSSNIEKSLSAYIGNDIIRERIKEKLDIAFGLLRKPGTEYDRRFLYTNYELAFLTYFSIFNEIIFAKIERKKIKKKQYTLKLKDTEKYLIDKEGKSLLKFYNKKWVITDTPSQFESPKKNLKADSIFIQITFLILTHNNYDKIKSYDLIQTLEKINNKRNHLDYTHPTSDSMEKTIKDNREKDLETLKEDCKNVLKVLSFLLT